MNKRKLLLVALSLCMVAILAVGGSLAYLTDTDSETNVFTVGNVTIDLWEDFQQGSKLMPVTYDENGDRIATNVVNKEVYVTNTGSEDCYVRVHIAIPSILDDGNPTFDASKNVLHFNAEDGTYGDKLWNWGKALTDNDNLADGKMLNNSNWNFYTETINNIPYNVYVVTYETILPAADAVKGITAGVTESAMLQVYLDSKVTSEDMEKLVNGFTDDDGEFWPALGTNWKMYVGAEAVQAAGFADAFTAFNESFGAPSTHEFTWDLSETPVTDTVGDANK